MEWTLTFTSSRLPEYPVLQIKFCSGTIFIVFYCFKNQTVKDNLILESI